MRTKAIEINFSKTGKNATFASKCPVKKVVADRPCHFVHSRKYQQIYHNIHFLGIAVVNVIKCLPCGSGEIDLLRDAKKIELLGGEEISWTRICDGKNIKKQDRDHIVPVMVTDNPTPHPRKFAHFTVELIVHVLIKLFHKPCINFWFNDIIENYAETAYKLYGKMVSYTKLLKEAAAVFVEIDTFRKVIVHILNEHLEPALESVFDAVALYPLREHGVDGHWKIMLLMFINILYSRFKVKASVNFVTNPGLGMITNWSIYPGGGETHDRISELVVKPFVRSLEICPIYEPLTFSVGIDHPKRDSAVPSVISEKVKQKLSHHTEGGIFKSPITSIEYDT